MELSSIQSELKTNRYGAANEIFLLEYGAYNVYVTASHFREHLLYGITNVDLSSIGVDSRKQLYSNGLAYHKIAFGKASLLPNFTLRLRFKA